MSIISGAHPYLLLFYFHFATFIKTNTKDKIAKKCNSAL